MVQAVLLLNVTILCGKKNKINLKITIHIYINVSISIIFDAKKAISNSLVYKVDSKMH